MRSFNIPKWYFHPQTKFRNVAELSTFHLRCITRRFRTRKKRFLPAPVRRSSCVRRWIWSNLINTCYCYARSCINSSRGEIQLNSRSGWNLLFSLYAFLLSSREKLNSCGNRLEISSTFHVQYFVESGTKVSQILAHVLNVYSWRWKLPNICSIPATKFVYFADFMNRFNAWHKMQKSFDWRGFIESRLFISLPSNLLVMRVLNWSSRITSPPVIIIAVVRCIVFKTFMGNLWGLFGQYVDGRNLFHCIRRFIVCC